MIRFRHRFLGLCALVILPLCATISPAENWPQWRGAQLDGISHETGLPTRWSVHENVAWRVPLPGPAGSTPAVWEDRIFVTSTDGPALVLLCIGTDGKTRWQRRVSKTGGETAYRGEEGNNASPSPSTDGRHVWACMANGQLACYTVEGGKVWQVDLQKRYGAFQIQFGMSATPVLDGERLYLQLIHGDGDPATREARVVALDKNTGKEIWQTGRPSDAVVECEHSYASPVIYRDAQREFLLTHGADYLVAHRLKDGKELWRCGGLNPKGNYNQTLRFVASPVATDGIIIVPSAKRGPIFALRTTGEGNVTDQDDAFYWKLDRGTPDVPSPLVHDGLVYLYDENGVLTCLDAKTGEQYYRERTTGGVHRASPVYADGKIYLAARNSGIVTVVRAGKELEVLAQNEMGEPISASPAIANGRIYLRTFDALFAIGDK